MNGFVGLGPLQERYFELVRSVGKEVADPEAFRTIADFVANAVAAGRRLDAPEDRVAAQNYINYWVSRVASAVRLGAPDDDEPRPRAGGTPRFAETVLAPFDAAALDQAARAAEAWLDSHTDRAATARRILLRLVRLQPDGITFETLPTFRSAFFDFAEPEDVNVILKAFEDAGAVRIVCGARPELDSVALRSPALLEKSFDALWPTFARWREVRREFRRKAGDWKRKGGRADLDAAAFEDARLYHDRDRAEWDFLKAVRNGEQTRRDLIRFGFVLAAGFVLVLMPLAITAWLGWVQSDVNFKDAEAKEILATQAAKEARDAEDAAEKAAAEARTAEAAAKAAKDNLEAQRDLISRVECVRTLAEIGAARSDADLIVGLNRWKSLLDRYERQTPTPTRLLSTLNEHFHDDGGLAAMARSARAMPSVVRNDFLPFGFFDREIPWYNGEEWRKFNYRVLALAHEFRNELVNRGDPYASGELRAIRESAYQRVGLCLNKFIGTVGVEKSFDDAAPYVREFWLNYWGDLGLVESFEVSAAMAKFGDRLTKIEDGLPRYAFQDFFRTYRRNLLERHDPRHGKSFPTRIASLDALTDHYRLYSRMVGLSELDALDRLAENVKAAMRADKDRPVLRHGAMP